MSYVKSTGFGAKWELPSGDMSWSQMEMLSSYINKYLPKKDTRYTVQEFYDIIDKRARACPKKERMLKWLNEMLIV